MPGLLAAHAALNLRSSQLLNSAGKATEKICGKLDTMRLLHAFAIKDGWSIHHPKETWEVVTQILDCFKGVLVILDCSNFKGYPHVNSQNSGKITMLHG